MDNLLEIVRAALGLGGAALALSLVLGRRRRHEKPAINLGLLSPAASATHSGHGTATRAN